jgi:hypothetical protein
LQIKACELGMMPLEFPERYTEAKRTPAMASAASATEPI